jgi:RNA polymerase sigma-70 factor (ECF subfamily)
MDRLTDEALYSRFRKGETAAFDMLYERYRQPLYLFLLRSTPSKSDAEDLFQELWTRVIHARDQFQEGSVKAWLFRIARNLEIDMYRRRSLRPMADSERVDASAATDPLPEQRAHDADCGDRLVAAIDSLPRDQREAFLLKEETGLPLTDIAQLVSVGRETIKSRLRYAMKHLREILEDCL